VFTDQPSEVVPVNQKVFDLFLYLMSPGFFFEFLQLVFSELDILFPSVDQPLDTSQIVFPAQQRSWRMLGTWSNDVIGDTSNVYETHVEDFVCSGLRRRRKSTIGCDVRGWEGLRIGSE
jgi:hypothetical protein